MKSRYTPTVVPAVPGFYKLAVAVDESGEPGSNPELFITPIVAWVACVDEDGEGYCGPMTVDTGDFVMSRDAVVLTPAGTVEALDWSLQSLEAYAKALGEDAEFAKNAKAKQLSPEAVEHLLLNEVPRIRAICRLPHWIGVLP